MKERRKVRWNWDAATHRHVREEVPIGKYIVTDEDRIAIVSEYIGSHVPARQTVEKYHLISRQVLFNWMDKFVDEKGLVSLQDETNPSDPMAKRSFEDRVKALEAENKRLRKALELGGGVTFQGI